jgi:hypothetical protein
MVCDQNKLAMKCVSQGHIQTANGSRIFSFVIQRLLTFGLKDHFSIKPSSSRTNGTVTFINSRQTKPSGRRGSIHNLFAFSPSGIVAESIMRGTDCPNKHPRKQARGFPCSETEK